MKMKANVCVVMATLMLMHACMVQGLDNGLGRTPQMAWNSWNALACNISEDIIKDMANAMVKTGLADAGYNYLNLDDCWAISRDPNTGYVQEDAKNFPSGIKALADYVHGLGLKFGIYSDAGTLTCAGRPGSLGYEEQDATKYAEWGVDYLKFDNCYNENIPDILRYPTMRDALNRTGRPIFFSLCDWTVTTAVWGPVVGNSWRTTSDIYSRYESWTNNLDQTNAVAQYGGPGGWNDPDMLEVGNGPTKDENVAHFSLWAIAKAPLVLGNDLRQITPDVVDILTNKEVIAVNQDPLGKQGTRVGHGISVDPKIYGNLIFVDDCTGQPSQIWSYNSASKRIESKHVPGYCVGQFSRNWDCGPSIGGQLYMQPCNADVECGGKTQTWDLSTGKLQTSFSGQSTTLCAETVAGTENEVMLGWTCLPQGGEKQQWQYKPDGTIVNKYNGRCLTVSSGQEVWAGPLDDGSQAVVLFNRAATAQKVSVQFSTLGFSGNVTVRDLWAKQDLGSFSGAYTTAVNSHGAAMIKISQKK